MDVAFERRVIALYDTACDWPADRRDAMLAEALAGEPAMLDAVRAMFRAEAAFLPTLPPEPAAPVEDGPPPERIGRYRILGEIGRGGMGVVYRGERADGAFDQRVAIKLIRAGLFSHAALARFETERRLLARLHHPHIAQLLDGGMGEDGSSYIVMELIDGQPITEHAEAHYLSLAARLNLFLQACDAVECAHRNLVVHADIKPGNVVVADSFGVKLLDFGIARLVGDSTDDGAAAPHTPGYASPAQVAGQPVTPTDDVFGLGALLRALTDGVRGVDRDLAAIADKATAPDPAARYGAVSELAADIARWQRREPVTARPPTRRHRALLLWRRRKGPLSAAAIVLALLIGTATITTILYLQANAARAAAERRFEETRTLSRYLIDDVTRALAPLPGSGPIRQRIALRANAALEQLSMVPGASVELQADSARAYIRVGDILVASDPRYHADPQAGHAALLHAESELRRLTAAMPARSDLAVALAQAMVANARFLAIESNDPRGALRLLDDAAARLDRLPANPDSANVRWDLELARATINDQQGDSAANAKLLPPVIARYAALPLPQDAERALRIETGWTLLANAQYYLGDPNAALVSYRKALDALLPPAFASDARIVVRQGYTAFNVASTLAEQKRYDEALRIIQLGDAAMARLLDFDKGARSLHMQAIVKMEYATELAAVKRFDEGIAQARASVAERIAQARLQPANYDALRSVPVGLRPLAEMYRAAGRNAEACATLARTDAEWDAISRRMKLSGFDSGNERPIVRKLRAACAG